MLPVMDRTLPGTPDVDGRGPGPANQCVTAPGSRPRHHADHRSHMTSRRAGRMVMRSTQVIAMTSTLPTLCGSGTHRSIASGLVDSSVSNRSTPPDLYVVRCYRVPRSDFGTRRIRPVASDGQAKTHQAVGRWTARQHPTVRTLFIAPSSTLFDIFFPSSFVLFL